MKAKEFLGHLELLVRPTIIAVAMSLIWRYLFYCFHVHFREEDGSIMGSVLQVIATFHAIVAGNVLAKVWDEYKLVGRCVIDNDKNMFDRCNADRIPVAIHILLGSMSAVIQGIVMFVHFNGIVTGVVMSFSVAFVLALYWEVATNLDDPMKGIWYRKHREKRPDWFTKSAS